MRRLNGLILLCSLLLVSGCSRSWTKTTFETNMKGKATRTDTVELALSAGDALVIVGASRDIGVRSSSRNPRVTAKITIVAYTQEEAERALLAFRLITRRTSRGLEVKIGGDAGTYEIEGGVKVPYRAFSSFTATVPKDVKVIAETVSGDVEIKGN